MSKKELRPSFLKTVIMSMAIYMVFSPPNYAQLSGEGLDKDVLWMYDEAKWGISHHYLAGGTLNNAYYNITDYKEWDFYITNFDVDAYADLADKLGIGYVLLTITQNRGYLCTTSTVYDKNAPPCPSITPGCQNQKGTNRADYTPSRDLLGDLAIALKAKGIRTMAYLPAPTPDRWTGKQLLPVSFPDWYTSDFVGELANRWGTNVAGWWFDGWYGLDVDKERANDFPTTTKIWSAIRGGNPNAIVSFSNGWSSSYSVADKFSRYTQGESNDFPVMPTNRVTEGWNGKKAQYHGFSYLSLEDPVFAGWGQIKRNLKYPDSQVAQHTADFRAKGGVSTWDVAINPNGKWTLDRLKQLQTIGLALETTTDRTYSSLILVNNTEPGISYSGQWELSSDRGTGDYNQDVHYTRTDGDSFSFPFVGNSIVFATSRASDQGDVEVFIDNISQGIFSTHDPYKRQVQEVIFEKHDLVPGKHVLKVVKRSGTYMLMDLIGYSNGRAVINK